MTVKQLIEILSKVEDQDIRMMIKGYEGGFNDLIMIDNEPAIAYMVLDVNDEWYYGKHELAEDRDHLDKFQVVKAIIL